MWIKAGKFSDIEEGKSQIVNAENKEIAIFKIEGKVYAIENTCPHRGGPLAEGYVEGTEVTCPWHAWAFDLKTGACQSAPEFKQPVFKIKIENNEILIEV